MLKKRLIPVLFLKNGLIIRSESFRYHQIIGDPSTQFNRYNDWGVDELIYIDITREGGYDVRRSDANIVTAGKSSTLEILAEVASKCFVPLTIGGRIRTLDQIKARLSLGADKVSINTICFEDQNFISKAAKEFGSQCIVASMDVKLEADKYVVYIGGRTPSDHDVVNWARYLESEGAGEILLNSIHRDGVGTGYDIDLIQRVCAAVSIPVIALGGVGHWLHLKKCIEMTDVSALAVGNKFHFSEMSYLDAKKYLLKHKFNIRKSEHGFQ